MNKTEISIENIKLRSTEIKRTLAADSENRYRGMATIDNVDYCDLMDEMKILEKCLKDLKQYEDYIDLTIEEEGPDANLVGIHTRVY